MIEKGETAKGDAYHIERSGAHLGFQIRLRPAQVASGVRVFAALNIAQPISRRAVRPDMQNWNIAVTAFSKTPLLDTIRTPDDLRRLKVEQVRQVADELRQETIDAVSVTGGHFGAGLGVVELTTALHYIFDTPRDRLIWDVGHQAYPHKILTGRRDRIRTLRTGGGLSGFTKRTESDYDPFGAAHSSTSISAGARHGGGARPLRRQEQRHRRDRRRRDVGGHGL